MRKSTLFVVLLLCIVATELFMVFSGRVGKQAQNFALDSKTYDMPVRETEPKVVKPFLFELHSADEVDAILDEFAASINKNLSEQSIKPESEEVAETESVTEENVPEVSETEDMPIAEVINPAVETEAKAAEVKAEVEAEVVAAEAELKAEAESVFEDTVVAKNAEEQPLPEKVTAENKIDTPEVVEAKEDKPEPKEIPSEKAVTAEPAAEGETSARVAIVIDDVGLSVPFTKQISQVKAPLTVSFLPYGASNKEQVNLLRNAGFEVMLHIPMMPHVPVALAPVTLSPEMSKQETQAELEKMLNRFEGTGMSGVNNHMGSLFTERVKNMNYVMEVLQKHKMFFLDSKTTGKSMARKSADEYGVAYVSRDVFLDNKNEYNYIMGQFRQLEKIARKNGFAVAIGHPYSQTLRVLNDWLKESKNEGIEVVHLSDLLVNK